MPRRVPLPAVLRAGPFSGREADAVGVGRERLRSRDVGHPFHGVHVAGPAPQDWRDRVEVLARTVLLPGQALSHGTAALLLGAPLPARVEHDPRLHVTSIGIDDRMRRPGVVGHRAASLDTVRIRGLPVAAPAPAWAQLATTLGHDDLVAVGDFLVTPPRRGTLRLPPLCTLDDLRAAVRPGHRGAARARRALAGIRTGAESRMETLLRLLLLRAGLPEPLLNPPLPIGREILHPDLAYPHWRVVLEYEGDDHRTDAEQWRRDITRRERFESAGWRVIRVHRDDVLGEPEAFLARVCHVLAARVP